MTVYREELTHESGHSLDPDLNKILLGVHWLIRTNLHQELKTEHALDHHQDPCSRGAMSSFGFFKKGRRGLSQYLVKEAL